MNVAPVVEESKADVANQELRSQPRADIAIDCHVKPVTQGFAAPATLRNISWGGAEFTISFPPGDVGSHIWLELPWKRLAPISVKAKIMRCRQDQKQRYMVGVRFSSLSPEQNGKLEELLNVLFVRSGARPEDDLCLSKRLHLMFDDPTEMRSTLDGIGQGSLAVMVAEEFEHNDSLQLLISDLNGVSVVNLRGRVARQTKMNMGQTTLYRLNLAFEHSIKELKAHVDRAREWTLTRQ